MTTVEEFLSAKLQDGNRTGFKPLWMPSCMFDFQKALTEWNIEAGKSASLADCGLGKTLMELVWSENVVRHTNRPVLIITPLAVARQTIREAGKFGIEARRSNDGTVHPGINVTNYEKLHHFDPANYAGVVCDESSCLKAFNGKTRAKVTEFLRTLPYRVLATATPAPNDYIELGTHSEALGIMGQMDMLSRFFRNNRNNCDTRQIYRRSPAEGGPQSAGWRFKGHAEIPFMRWVASWARALRRPSDLGFDDGPFVLPELEEREHIIETKTLAEGFLFPMPATNMREERDERRRTIEERCQYAASLVKDTGEPFVIWCHLNAEGDMLTKLLGADCVNVSGSDSDEEKEEAYEAFALGQIRGLSIKPKIGAHGLNWQFCNHTVSFASHSYEQYYQQIRRFWRFGQKRKVRVDLIATEGERGAKENMQRKAVQADRMFALLVENMNQAIRIDASRKFIQPVEVPTWVM